jgi:hypothetical protein
VRRLLAIAAAALLVMVAVPLSSAGSTTVATKHVDGTVKVYEPAYGREWLARFEVRTTPSGVVQFGYMHLYGITAGVDHPNAGEIHEFSITSVSYSKTTAGQQAWLGLEECVIYPYQPCFQPGVYQVIDGSTVGQPDQFENYIGWSVESGNISIYTTSDQNSQ